MATAWTLPSELRYWGGTLEGQEMSSSKVGEDAPATARRGIEVVPALREGTRVAARARSLCDWLHVEGVGGRVPSLGEDTKCVPSLSGDTRSMPQKIVAWWCISKTAWTLPSEFRYWGGTLRGKKCQAPKSVRIRLRLQGVASWWCPYGVGTPGRCRQGSLGLWCISATMWTLPPEFRYRGGTLRSKKCQAPKSVRMRLRLPGVASRWCLLCAGAPGLRPEQDPYATGCMLKDLAAGCVH